MNIPNLSVKIVLLYGHAETIELVKNVLNQKYDTPSVGAKNVLILSEEIFCWTVN